MVQSFPRGRTTKELLVLVGASFSHDKRVAVLSELDELLKDGKVEKGRDGRWRPKRPSFTLAATSGLEANAQPNTSGSEGVIHAAAALYSQRGVTGDEPDESDKSDEKIDPHALLLYWRSALRADPRGATTQVQDKHGIEWSLISGRGPISPDTGGAIVVTISLDALAPRFQEALVRREGHENGLAIGWPIYVGRQAGMPVFQPVGLLAASWERNGESLVLTVDSDDVVVNPDWIRTAARKSGWSHSDLADLFGADDGVGLRTADFVEKLRVAVASQIRGRIVGEDLVTQIDPTAQGIYDSAAVFLPTDSSFTAGAARDLDEIATWPRERIARTALGAALGLDNGRDENLVPAIDSVPLNKEQLRAVRCACESQVSVVTGPPGTGKSQAIVSMAASILASGGSVLVASKNHQALDAVEERLGAIAPDLPFFTRTLNPKTETNQGFTDVLKKLIDNESTTRPLQIDSLFVEQLNQLAKERREAMDLLERSATLECEIADVLERIEFREQQADQKPSPTTELEISKNWLERLAAWFHRLFSFGKYEHSESNGSDVSERSLPGLRDQLGALRRERDMIGNLSDPIALGERILELTTALLPRVLARRSHLPEERRQQIAVDYDDWQFDGGKGHPPTDLTRQVLQCRPLWLASILGTPRRIPLDDGLFDLVIFDEASQCDIATAIPLLARAKRAVVVGDDRQLSFIPQLGRAQDRNLMQAQNLPATGMGRFAQSSCSLFDFASRIPGAQRITLRHQYRSAGPIVEYISENFYGGQLETSYDPERLVVPKGMKPGLFWEDVPAPGVPQEGNVNRSEISAIVHHLDKLLNGGEYGGSIGVISPFRAQVMELENAIRRAIPETRLIAAELKVGTVDGFQGQERDLVLFSPCVGPRSPQSGITFFQKDARRLNVAISRARAVAMIFGDLSFARSGQSKALQRLAAKATEPRTRIGEGVFDSNWERKVYYALKDRGLDPQPQFEIAGRRLDFALFGVNGTKLDLEVDGRRWHQTADGRRKTSDLWRDHQMQSLGWRVRRFWVDELARDMEGCLDRVEQDLS